MRNRAIRIPAILLLASALSACGGSGESPGAAAVATLITSSNADAVAGNTADAAFATGDIADLLADGLFSPTGGIPNVSSKFGAPVSGGWFVATALDQLDKITYGPITADCATSGSITFNGTVEDPQTLTGGDYVDVAFDMCDNDDGKIIDGGFGFTVNMFNGNLGTGLFELDVSLVLGQLTVTDLYGQGIIDGDVSVSIDTFSAPLHLVAISGNSLMVSHAGVTKTLREFATTRSADMGSFPAAWTFSSSGNLTSSLFDGQVDYSTPLTFQGSGRDYPYSGEFLIRGANNASIHLITLDNVKVLIEIDRDGDGATDESREVLWTDLRN